MNIFEQYLDKIKQTLLDFSKKGDLVLPDSLDGITAEIPPSKFNSDISTNVAMVLSKINKKPPIELANTLSEEIKKKDKLFLRWFTPKVEIDLCGHATLAAAHILYSEMNYKSDFIEFNIKSGDVLTVNRNDNLLTMNFPAYEPKIVDHSLEELYNAFGIRPKLFLYCKLTYDFGFNFKKKRDRLR